MFEDTRFHEAWHCWPIPAWQQPKEHAAPNWCKHQWNKSYEPANVQPTRWLHQVADKLIGAALGRAMISVRFVGVDLCSAARRPLGWRQWFFLFSNYLPGFWHYSNYLYSNSSRSMMNPWFVLFWNRNSVLLSLLTFQKSVWNLQLFVTTFGRSVPTWQGPNTPLTKQVTCKPAWTKSWTKYIPFNQLMWWKHCWYFAQLDYNGQMLSITSLKHSFFCSDWLEWPDSVHTLTHLQNWCPFH